MHFNSNTPHYLTVYNDLLTCIHDMRDRDVPTHVAAVKQYLKNLENLANGAESVINDIRETSNCETRNLVRVYLRRTPEYAAIMIVICQINIYFHNLFTTVEREYMALMIMCIEMVAENLVMVGLEGMGILEPYGAATEVEGEEEVEQS